MQKHLSGIALLTLIILIVVAILGVLALSTASSQLKLANYQAEHQSAVQECTNKANRWLAEIDSEIKAGSLNGQTIEKEFADENGRVLKISVSFSNNEYKVNEWISYTKWDSKKHIDLYSPE